MKERKANVPKPRWAFLPEELQDSLSQFLEESVRKYGSPRGTWMRHCPVCGRRTIDDCFEVAKIEDHTVGVCITCGYLVCLECDAELVASITCGHRRVCETCGTKKNGEGDCGTAAWKCDSIREWTTKRTGEV